MKRQWLIAASSVLVVGILALSATPAVAGNKVKPTKYQGPAPGTVSCSVSVRVKYSPSMTDSGGTPSHLSVHMSGCQASDSRVKVASAKLAQNSSTSAFTANALNCQPVNTVPTGFNIAWRGRFTGMQGTLPVRGKATYAPSEFDPTSQQIVTSNGHVGLEMTGTVSNSFSDVSSAASIALYTNGSQHAFDTTCAGKGFHTLKLHGTITLG